MLSEVCIICKLSQKTAVREEIMEMEERCDALTLDETACVCVCVLLSVSVEQVTLIEVDVDKLSCLSQQVSEEPVICSRCLAAALIQSDSRV